MECGWQPFPWYAHYVHVVCWRLLEALGGLLRRPDVGQGGRGRQGGLGMGNPCAVCAIGVDCYVSYRSG